MRDRAIKKLLQASEDQITIIQLTIVPKAKGIYEMKSLNCFFRFIRLSLTRGIFLIFSCNCSESTRILYHYHCTKGMAKQSNMPMKGE